MEKGSVEKATQTQIANIEKSTGKKIHAGTSLTIRKQ